MSRKTYQPNSKIILLLFSLLFVILMLGTWVSSVLVQERQDLRNQAYIGDITDQYCNQPCSKNSQCANDFICFGGQCRLSTNPSNLYCQGKPDQGIHRSCNQYCADTNECETGYVCYYNACRNPNNVTNEYCIITNPTTIPTRITTNAPLPTVTLAPKGGILDQTELSPFPTNLPKTTPTPNSIDIFRQVTSPPQPTLTQLESDLETTFSDQLLSIPSYMWYGIGTLVVFFTALLIYIIHSWKSPQSFQKKSTHPHSPVDMKNFAGNMEAHKKLD